MGTLRVLLFGTVRITHDNCPAEVRVGPKAQVLLAYLLLNGQRSHSREILTEIFWRDRTPRQARSCLNTTVWRLRQAIEKSQSQPAGYLLSPSNDEIGFNWNSNHWLDTAVFETHVERLLAKPVSTIQGADVQRLKEMVSLYTGDLLEGIYDDWAISKQERLRCLYLDGLEHLMRYYSYHGAFADSLSYGQRILEREPLREQIHREMMRLYLASGQRALAVRQYEMCRQILAQELGIAPMDETNLVYAQAREGTVQPQRSVLQPQTHEQLKLAVLELSQAQQQLKQAAEKLEHSQRLLSQVLHQADGSVSTTASKRP